MIVLIGKSGSGKTTMANILCEKFGYHKVVTTTTRPMRKNEKQDIDYHFVSKHRFDELKNEGKFVETREYHVANGDVWEYGSPVDVIKNASNTDIIILTPEGCHKVIETFGRENLVIIYIYANLRAIEYRLTKRGDSKDEIKRRMAQDQIDFKGVEDMVNFIAYNHYGDSILEAVTIVHNYLKKRGVYVEKD